MPKKLNNESGAILILTMLFVLAFTSLGIASIHFAGVQNEFTERLEMSTEAFWLADGGIQRAYSGIQQSPSITYYDAANPGVYEVANSNLPLGRGTYNIYSIPEDCDPDTTGIQPCAGDQHDMKALGNVLGQVREVMAQVGRHDVDDAITSHGPIANDCEPNSQAANIDGNCDENAAFTFEEVLGMNYNDVVASADNTYANPCNNCVPQPPDRSDGQQTDDIGLWGVTYVHFTSAEPSPGLNINNAEALQHVDGGGNLIPSLLIIDTTNASKLATIRIEGGTGFRGIIWIKGEADIQGGTDVLGSIFVDCTTCANVRVSGTASLTYDGAAIDAVVDEMFSGTGGPAPLRIVSWQECPNSGCTF